MKPLLFDDWLKTISHSTVTLRDAWLAGITNSKLFLEEGNIPGNSFYGEAHYEGWAAASQELLEFYKMNDFKK